jgi:hypothetical protein
MTADERLALVRPKIERADTHIADLNTLIQTFYNTYRYEISTRSDRQNVELIPASISLITGDVLNNLQQALDDLAQQLYLVGSSSATFRAQTSFPIAASPTKFKFMLGRKVEGMKQDAIDAICALEPYKGGKGTDLWKFHRLYLGGKTAREMNRLLPEGAQITPFALFIRAADKSQPNAGNIISSAQEIEQNQDREFTFEIAIYESGLIDGEALLETLVRFRDRINSVITDFRPYLV